MSIVDIDLKDCFLQELCKIIQISSSTEISTLTELDFFLPNLENVMKLNLLIKKNLFYQNKKFKLTRNMNCLKNLI